MCEEMRKWQKNRSKTQEITSNLSKCVQFFQGMENLEKLDGKKSIEMNEWIWKVFIQDNVNTN